MMFSRRPAGTQTVPLFPARAAFQSPSFVDRLRAVTTSVALKGAILAVEICALCYGQGARADARGLPESANAVAQAALRLERIGRVEVRRSSGDVIYERFPPYHSLPDFGLGRLGPYDAGAVIYFSSGGGAKASPLFKPTDAAGYRIASLSPKQDRLAFYEIKRTGVRLGVFKFDTRETTFFDAAPNIMPAFENLPAWTESDIVYAAMAEGEQPMEVSLRTRSAARLTEAWTRTWDGREPSYRLLESTDRASPGAARDGRLVSGSLRTGQLKTLARGLFADLQISPDGKMLAGLKQFTVSQPDPERQFTSEVARRFKLSLIDLRTGRETDPITELDVQSGSLVWSPENRLALYAWNERETSQTGRFRIVAEEGGLTTWHHYGLDLVSQRERGYPEQQPERAIWLGDRIAVVARRLGNASAAPTLTPRPFTRSKGAKPLIRSEICLIGDNVEPVCPTTNMKVIDPFPIGSFEGDLYITADNAIWKISSDGSARAIFNLRGRSVVGAWSRRQAGPDEHFLTS